MDAESTRAPFTAREQRGIDRANTADTQPVVFVHGLWLLASSWDRWRDLFEQRGFVTLAPGLARRPRDRRRGASPPDVP